MSRKDHTATRARLVLTEIREGRLERSEAAIIGYLRRNLTISKAEERQVVRQVMRDIALLPAEPEEEKSMTQPKNVLRGKAIVPVAAAIWREHPDATSSEVYSRMLQAGYRIPMKCASFEAAYAPAAREMAGSKGSLAAPAPPEREPAREVQEPSHDPADPEPVAVATAPAAPSVEPAEGDFINFRLGGQKLEASRTDDEWRVAFEGTVGDSMVRESPGSRVWGESVSVFPQPLTARDEARVA